MVEEPEKDGHDDRGQDGATQDPDHDQVALPILSRSRLAIRGPALVQRVRCDDRADVAEARHKSRGGSDPNFAMPPLKDLVRPGHANWYGGP